ncbi:beta strand repeat-containing protein [Caulifigura coniformis]|uniref:beta strand repeat-containing protein n=1 Tax=Caulifigura coniformis TaxID=2527983 RepID=UPI0011A5C970|nr:hypothetical protein [Caulifigura coniformis]
MQRLESRVLLSAVTWTGGAGTSNWSDGSNWSGGAVPGPGDDVSIFNTTVRNVAGTIRSLSVSNGTLEGGALILESGVTLSSGARLKDVALSGSAYTLTSYHGILDAASLSGHVTMASVNGSVHLFRVQNGLTLNGTAALSGGGIPGSGPAYSGFVFEGNQTLAGAGTIVFTNNYNNAVVAASGSALTIDSGITIRTNGPSTSGYVGWAHHGVSGGTDFSTTSFINFGTILADGGSILVRGNGSVNNSILGAVNGGELKFEGATTNNTTISAGPSCQVDVNGVITGGAITAADGAIISVSDGNTPYGGRLKNLTVSGGSYSLRSYRGLLDAVSISGNVSLAFANGSIHFRVQNGLTLNGTATLGGGGIPGGGPAYSGFVFEGNQTLGGTGTIVFANNFNNAVAAGAGSVLTIGSGITIRTGGASTLGYLGFVHHFISGGTDDTSTSIINQGTILADGGSILIRGNGSVNSGSLGAVNGGELKLQGALTNTSTISVGMNSKLDVNGVVEGGAMTGLDGAEIGVSAGTSYGGALKSVALEGSVYALRSFNGVLDAVTISGNATLSAINSTPFRVRNGLTLNGTATLIANSNYAGFVFEGSQALSGNGVIVFGGTSLRNVLVATENSTLTLGSMNSSPENSITVRWHAPRRPIRGGTP